jgi:regulator of protease activity HflC (stomatin/prohibitin superfamily)
MNMKIRFNIVSALIIFGFIGLALALSFAFERDFNPVIVLPVILIGVLLSLSAQVVNQWESAVVLRLGKFHTLRGPGLFWIIPFIDTITDIIDQRIVTTNFDAEQTLTADTVPVNVDAVLFWVVTDVKKAALEVQNYRQAVSWAAQTALRDIIGRTSLVDLLHGREKIEEELQSLIDERSTPWGMTVQSVEMRDIVIPDNLQDAMSREAQASREKRARIILSEAEVEVAKQFHEAANVYDNNPIAFQLRQINVLLEGLKDSKSSIVLLPTATADSLSTLGASIALKNDI